MKHSKHLLLTVVALLVAMTGRAYTHFYDNIYYNYNSTADNYTVTYRYSDGATYSGSITVPAKVYSKPVVAIGEWAFWDCSTLTYISLPTSIKTIGKGAFKDCIGLTSIVIPEGVTTIENYAFENCTGLISVTLPSTLVSIGEEAFKNCSLLNSITLPENLTSIGQSAFAGCSSLTSITTKRESPIVIHSNVFDADVESSVTLTVPSGTVNRYREQPYWSEFKTISDGSGTNTGGGGSETPGTGGSDEPNTNPNPDTNNVLVLSDMEVLTGNQYRVPIKMTNTDDITAAQFDLYLPYCATIATDEDGELIELGDRATTRSHSIAFNAQSDGAVRIIISSTSSAAFKNNSGVIAYVTVNVTKGSTDGDYPFYVKNIVLSSTSATQYKPANVSAIMTVKSYTLGDVDNNGEININDAVCVINHILGKSVPTFIEAAADVDGSGDINVNDAVMLINKYILNKNAARQLTRAPRRADGQNSLSISSVTIKQGEKQTISVDMSNVDEVSGLQCRIKVPEGISFTYEEEDGETYYDMEMAASRINSRDPHSIQCNMQEDGTMGVVIVNTNGKTLKGNSGTLFTFQVEAAADAKLGTYQFEIKDIVLSVNNVAEKPADVSADFTITENTSTAVERIEQRGINHPNDIFTLQGRKVSVPRKGLYIIDGKKRVVR